MADPTADDAQKQLMRIWLKNRPLAHRTLFAHRHPQAQPAFHVDMINAWHGDNKRDQFLVFRGGAKSTIAEEAITIKTVFREFRNCLIIGANEDKAGERLAAIAHELETNEKLQSVFGDPRGSTWGDFELVTSSNLKIQARGRGQSLRGVKHLDWRPDLVLLDDIEDRKDMTRPELRKAILTYVMTDVIPALDPSYQMRMNATPLHPEALPLKFEEDEGWVTHKYPVYHYDKTGARVSSWPERFPLDAPQGLSKKQLKELGVEPVNALEASFTRLGMKQEFNCEYLMQAEVPEEKPFKDEMIRIEPTVRTWQAVYAMFDPARTISQTAAGTGYAAWSWVGPKLVVWDAWGRKLLPNEIVDAVFACNETWSPVLIGVELDGLEEWLSQPIRQEQARRGVTLPVKGMRAPKGKHDFIRSLQPFYNAREVVHASSLPDLKRQLLGFPSGLIDVPNALAYALKMRPGAPVYDDFGHRHISEELTAAQGRPLYLAMNATGSYVTAMLVQVVDGTLRILADWLREGEPLAIAADVLSEANLRAGRSLSIVGGPLHFDQYNNVGLRQALGRIPAQMQKGLPPSMGRPFIVNLLRREARGFPMLAVSPDARWTLNGFAAGYCRGVEKNGTLSESADEGVYRTMMEGLESFAGLLTLGSPETQNDDRHYAYTSDGRRYTSALVRGRNR